MIPNNVDEYNWRDDAACAETDGDLFFPRKGGHDSPGIRICNNCPVRTQCLDYAITTEQIKGIWGGTTPSQRRRMRVANEKGGVA
jgi:WhiB family redox-sensing transcriptional regulator